MKKGIKAKVWRLQKNRKNMCERKGRIVTRGVKEEKDLIVRSLRNSSHLLFWSEKINDEWKIS